MKTYQVGGTHYQKYKIQPIDLIAMCKWDFIQGNIAKYILRYKYKDGIKDLRKALQYVEFGVDTTYTKVEVDHSVNFMIIDQFVEINHIDARINEILGNIEKKNWTNLNSCIEDLITIAKDEKEKPND